MARDGVGRPRTHRRRSVRERLDSPRTLIVTNLTFLLFMVVFKQLPTKKETITDDNNRKRTGLQFNEFVQIHLAQINYSCK